MILRMQNYTIKLKEKYEVADRTLMLIFEKPKDFSFQAGQYVVMTLPKLVFPDERRGMRSLSIASAPYEDVLAFAMRITASGFKKTIDVMEVGDEVTITQAVGHFILPAEDVQPIIFLIGGIGITPARSILRQSAHDGRKQSFTLFYSNRTPEDVSFAQELQSIDGLLNYRCVDTMTAFDGVCSWQEERGYICKDMVEKYVADMPGEALYYIVGGPKFIQAMEAMLQEMNVPSDRVKKDPFTGI